MSPVIFQSIISLHVWVFTVYIMCVCTEWNSMKHTPPCTNWTNTPLSMKHAWKTAQPTSAFPVWRRQSEQCFLTGEQQTVQTWIQTQLFSPSASSGSQNSNESCGNLSNYVLFFCQLMLNAFGIILSAKQEVWLAEKWKIQSL